MNTLSKPKLSISLGADVDYSFKDKVSKTAYCKQEIDARIKEFRHLNCETGHPISQGKEVTEMIGMNFFTWLSSHHPSSETVKVEFTKRVIGLVRDLQTEEEFQAAVVTFAGENLTFLDLELLMKARLSFKIVHHACRGMSDESTRVLLEKNLESISRRLPTEGVSYFDSSTRHVVFTLHGQKGLIFKLVLDGDENSLNDHINNCEKAHQACVQNNLDLIVIPKAEKMTLMINGKKYCLIVAEKVNADTDEKRQLYANTKEKAHLKEAVIQLVTFIFATRYKDVTPRNVFVLKKEEDNTRGRFAVIDLDQWWSSEIGIFGRHRDVEWGDSGLLNMVSLDLIDTVIDAARKVIGSAFSQELEEAAKYKRDERYRHEQELQKFYEDKEVKTGLEKVCVDLEPLFPDQVEREIASILIDSINEHIAKPGEEMPPKFRRRIAILKREVPEFFVQRLSPALPGEVETEWQKLFENSSQLEFVIDRLVKENIIYRRIPGHLNYGYYLQA